MILKTAQHITDRGEFVSTWRVLAESNLCIANGQTSFSHFDLISYTRISTGDSDTKLGVDDALCDPLLG